MSLTLGSLFDGSGGFPLAGSMYGIIPVWASEVEPYPIAVTYSRFPHMKHLGDVTKLNGAEIPPVDIITFGSPCQSLSVAGLRHGIKHESLGDEHTSRSGLFLDAIRIIKEMREATNGRYPTVAVWENVGGAFSSSKGEDFRIVLESFVKVEDSNANVPRPEDGKWSDAGSIIFMGGDLCWRTLDAQYWGVPQRRRRIYLCCTYSNRGHEAVTDTGDSRSEKILFKFPCLHGYFTESGTPWKSFASDTQGSVGETSAER